jgi:hypothetical protein
VVIASAKAEVTLVIVDTTPTASAALKVGLTGKLDLNGDLKLNYKQSALGGSIGLKVSFLFWSWTWTIYHWKGIGVKWDIFKFKLDLKGKSGPKPKSLKIGKGKANYSVCKKR